MEVRRRRIHKKRRILHSVVWNKDLQQTINRYSATSYPHSIVVEQPCGEVSASSCPSRPGLWITRDPEVLVAPWIEINEGMGQATCETTIFWRNHHPAITAMYHAATIRYRFDPLMFDRFHRQGSAGLWEIGWASHSARRRSGPGWLQTARKKGSPHNLRRETVAEKLMQSFSVKI